MAVNNNKLRMANDSEEFCLSSPFICIDNYLLCCEWKASSFVPKVILKVSDLAARVKKELAEQCPRLRNLSDRRGSDSNIFAREASRSRKTDNASRKKCKSWDGNDSWEQCFALNTTDHDAVLVHTHDPDTTIGNDNTKTAAEENVANKRREYSNSVSVMSTTECEEYINTESLTRAGDLLMLIEIIMKSKTPAMFMLRLQSETDMCITYQFLPRFKQEYMIVPVNQQYCILMKTF